MKYLAFDIEAANGYQLSSICSIGVVIADEKFNIVSRENIWINPKTKYNLNGTRQNVGIDLHLDKKLLESSPDFSRVYDKIKALLESDDYTVLGHAVDADVRMLNAACSRYKLPCINFDFICSQLLFKLYKGEKEVKALNKIAAEIGVEFTQHNSEEDAYATMMTLKYLVESSGLSVDELLEKYHIRKGVNKNFEMTRPVTLDGQVSKKRVTQIAIDNIKKYAATIRVKSGRYRNIAFCLARSLELSDDERLYRAVKKIIENGGKYATKLFKGNVYIYGDNSSEQDVLREKRVQELVQQGLMTTVNINEFLEKANMTAKEFLKKHRQSVDDVIVDESINDFIAKMRLGLSGNGGIPMIPTYLMNVDRSLIKTNDKRILIDAGGTNFRAAIGYFDENQRVVIENLEKSKMPASDGTYYGKEDFYNTLADRIKNHLTKASNIGFCFSYQVDMGPDVDGEVVMFSKEINAPEVIGTKVGRETLAACKRYSDTDRKIVILNDTVATLLGGMANSDKKYSAYLGYIYGTGTNVCYIEHTANITKVNGLPDGEMLINTECGNFDGFVQGDFDKISISSTAVPNKQLFEKMTSGKYLADIIAEALAAAQNEGCFEDAVALVSFELKDVSEFLDGGEFPCKFANALDERFAGELCRELVKRAALMGAIVNSAIAIASCKDKSLPIAIVAEGTTFNRLTGYRAEFEKYLTEILGKRGISYEILQGEELNLVGTLMASMIF